MTTETETLETIDLHFLRRMLLHSLKWGIQAVCIPFFSQVAFALMTDRSRLGQYLAQNWVFDVLVLVIFFLAGSLFGCIRFSHEKLPLALSIGSGRWTRDELLELLGGIHDVEQPSGDYERIPSTNRCRAALGLLEIIGLIRPSRHTFVAASPAAESALASLRAHLRGGNPNFIGDWQAGTNSPESRRLTRFIRVAEQYRVDTAPGDNPVPAMVTRAGIALIRADFNGIEKILMIKSRMWDPRGAWTPVMGRAEPADLGELENTVKREVREEMRIESNDALKARELATVHDKRISKRTGLYTEYTYGIFAVELEESPAMREFLVDYHTVRIYFDHASRDHEFHWFTWDELLASRHLRLNMPTVLGALRGIGPGHVRRSASVSSEPD